MRADPGSREGVPHAGLHRFDTALSQCRDIEGPIVARRTDHGERHELADLEVFFRSLVNRDQCYFDLSAEHIVQCPGGPVGNVLQFNAG